MYCRYGTKSVTMDEIADQSGVSKKTIYQYFADKNELVKEVLLSILEMNAQACETSREQADNAIEEVFLISDSLEHLIQILNPSFVVDLRKGHPQCYKEFENYRDHYVYPLVFNNVERGKQEGLYRKSLNTDVITKMRLETFILPFNIEVFPRDRYRAMDVQEELLYYYLYGMATAKGHTYIENLQKEREKAKQ